MNRPPVLIVDDDRLMAAGLSGILANAGYPTVLAHDGAGARRVLAEQTVAVVLLDLSLPDTDGRALLREWQAAAPDRAVIVITGQAELAIAVDCLKAGAHDFITKPVDATSLLKSLDQACRETRLRRRADLLTRLQRGDGSIGQASGIVAESSAMQELLRVAMQVAASPCSSILITGESGTGKGMLAAAIHRASPRADAPFVAVNCAALPGSLWESEFFGHLKGAFTDAKTDRAGLFEMADGGVLFLDEIGDMEPALQTKLLKVIEDQTFRRVGSTTDIRVDVAIIAATNHQLQQRVADGAFREDLYFRLNVIPLHVPPLRERPADIMPMAESFREQNARRLGKSLTGFSAAAASALRGYPWPGNARELRNVIERGCILCPGGSIDTPHLLMPSALPSPARAAATPVTLAEAECETIQTAMRAADGNKNRAADILGIHRTTLYAKLKHYGIDG